MHIYIYTYIIYISSYCIDIWHIIQIYIQQCWHECDFPHHLYHLRFLGRVTWFFLLCRMAFALEVQKATLRERNSVAVLLLWKETMWYTWIYIYIYMKVYNVHWVIWWNNMKYLCTFTYFYYHILLPFDWRFLKFTFLICEWRMVYITRVLP